MSAKDVCGCILPFLRIQPSYTATLQGGQTSDPILESLPFIVYHGLDIPGRLEFTDDQNEMIGCNIGDYRVLARFDLGESGSVFKAVHTTQRQTYLLKLLRGHLDRAVPAHHQFSEDIQLATYLDHPHIARTLPLEFHED